MSYSQTSILGGALYVDADWKPSKPAACALLISVVVCMARRPLSGMAETPWAEMPRSIRAAVLASLLTRIHADGARLDTSTL